MTTKSKYTDVQIEKVVKKLADGISIEHGRSSPLKMGAVMLRSLLHERQAAMQGQDGSHMLRVRWTDEDVEAAVDAYDAAYSDMDRGHENKMIAMRAALEAAIPQSTGSSGGEK